MRALIAAMVLVVMALAAPALAADPEVTDAGTVRLDGTSFRLDGVDAPDIDQMCLDPGGAVWPCGVEARDRLNAHIQRRAVRCEDKGPDPALARRRIGSCAIDGEPGTLNEWLVREGWAIRPDAKGRFAAEESDARENRRGLWRGCFAEPRDLRRWNLNGARLLGGGCQAGHENRTRDKLFRVDPPMPPGCRIKGKLALRAAISGYTGIYHMPGCRSYRKLKRAQRWFCSEDDAQAEGFRKALTCL
jgi:endonuclease YncB( thermonuclease family)